MQCVWEWLSQGPLEESIDTQYKNVTIVMYGLWQAGMHW